jgi:hypothetical protein
MVYALKDREADNTRRFETWIQDVTDSFVNVGTRFAGVAGSLTTIQKDLARQSTVGSGSGSGPRIRDGVLFPPVRSGDRLATMTEESESGDDDERDKLVADLRKRIHKLELARTSGHSGGSDGPPNFGNLGLTCIEDLESWNHERGLGWLFCLFQDAPSVLTFTRAGIVEAPEHIATMKRARDVGLNLIQAKVLVSFQNPVPLFFAKGPASKTSSLNALPTAKDWEDEDGTSGAKHDLDRALPSIDKQLQSYIDIYLGDEHHEARALATRCLNHSVLFVHKLSDFITRTYRTMMMLNYDPTKAWTFLMRQVKRIWEDIGRARACCTDLGSPTAEESGGSLARNHNAALAMWGILKAHDVMTEYLRHNFEDHPSIAAEQVRWVTRNVMSGERSAGTSDHKLLENRVSKNEKTLGAMKIRADKIEARVETVEKKV